MGTLTRFTMTQTSTWRMMAKGDLAGDYSIINCATLKRTKKEFFLLFVSFGLKVVNALENPKNLGA
jgi:hypothetical protein